LQEFLVDDRRAFCHFRSCRSCCDPTQQIDFGCWFRCGDAVGGRHRQWQNTVLQRQFFHHKLFLPEILHEHRINHVNLRGIDFFVIIRHPFFPRGRQRIGRRRSWGGGRRGRGRNLMRVQSGHSGHGCGSHGKKNWSGRSRNRRRTEDVVVRSHSSGWLGSSERRRHNGRRILNLRLLRDSTMRGWRKQRSSSPSIVGWRWRWRSRWRRRRCSHRCWSRLLRRRRTSGRIIPE